MESADEYLAAGSIEAARETLVAAVRSQPGDEKARMFLFQLFCVTGEWEKASRQLHAMTELSPDAHMLGIAYNQVISAERARCAAFAGSAPIGTLIDSPAWVATLATALEAFCRREGSAANCLREEAFDEASDTQGQFNEQPFSRLADMDARFGPAVEAIVAGHWGLIAFESIQEIRSEGPKDLRDLVWLPAEITPRSGPSFGAFLPVRYPGTESIDDGELRLSRRTEWREGVSGSEGVGQRQWFSDDGTEFGILSLRKLRFA